MRETSGGQVIGDPRGGGFWLEFYYVAEIQGTSRPKDGGQKLPMWRIRERNSGGRVIAYGEMHPDMPKNLQEVGRRWTDFLAQFASDGDSEAP